MTSPFVSTISRASLMVLAGVLATLGLVVVASSAQASGAMGGYHAFAWGAPIGQKGGIALGGAACADWRVQPRMRAVVLNLSTGTRTVHRWHYAGPGPLPRYTVGRYRVTLSATCGTHRSRKTETVRIRQKTAATTVSRAEFKRIHRGMTEAQVAQIVGYHGLAGRPHGGISSHQYDNMRFWRFSFVDFRDGRVVSKYWDLPHD